MGSAPALAYDEESHAAYQVQHDQLLNLAQRNQWQGADRVYRGMIEAKLHENMEFEDHMLGADAARSLGDVGAVQERYERGLQGWESIEVMQKLAAIRRQYGKVELLARAGGIKLVADERPFQTDLAASIDFAQATLQEHGKYEGVLPIGGYTMAGQHFDVALLKPPVVVNVRKAGEEIADQGPIPDADADADAANDSKKGGAAKIVLLGGAVAAVGAGGALFGMAKSKEAYYHGDDITYDELDGVADAANNLATMSVAVGAAGVVLGVGAVFVVTF